MSCMGAQRIRDAPAERTELTAAQKRMKYLKIGAAAVGGGALLAVTGDVFCALTTQAVAFTASIDVPKQSVWSGSNVCLYVEELRTNQTSLLEPIKNHICLFLGGAGINEQSLMW